METMLLYAFQNDDQLGDDAHIIDNLFERFKFSSNTPIFGPNGQSKSTEFGTMVLLYNLKAKFGLSNACFLETLR